MFEGLFLLLIFAVLHPLFLLILLLTIIFHLFMKRIRITFLVMIPLSAAVYGLLFKSEGLLHFDVYYASLLGIVAATFSVLLVYAAKVCLKKMRVKPER